MFCLLAESVAGSVGAAPRPERFSGRRILCLISYSLSHPESNEIVLRIRRELTRRLPGVDLNVIELDVLHTADQKEREKVFQRHLPALQAGQYDLIFALGDDALEQVLAHYASLPEMPPVIFDDVFFPPSDLQEKYPNVSGAVRTLEIDRTIATARRIHPEAKVAVLLVGSDRRGELFRRVLEERFRGKNDFPVQVVPISRNSIDALASIFAGLDRPIVILCPGLPFGFLGTQTLESFGDLLEEAAGTPFFTMKGNLFHHGGAGGHMPHRSRIAQTASAQMIEALARRKAVGMPLRTLENVPVYDLDALKRGRFDVQRLPAESFLLNRQEAFIAT
ncbi:MAG: hypothetical protein PHS41_10545 [Victivallaceae bacterium]|nr:hypothetical protein [Victivallaceae bacterium]